MRKLRSNEVFKPGAFPQHTYVSRMSADFPVTYEFRLEQALQTVGFLTSIIGPSKTGKTVLCEKVIGLDKMISLTGNDFKNSTNFWLTIANKVGLSLVGEQTETNSMQGKGMAGVTESKSSSITEKYQTGKDRVIDFFKEHDLVLVLDDFHTAPEEMQFDMAYQLKDAIRKEFKAIVISLPHRADDAIRKNPDLSGRLSLINIEPWQEAALKEIATTGFKALAVEITDEMANQLARESILSPQLMQSICLNLALLLHVDKDKDEQPHEITDKAQLELAYRVTSINFPYDDVVKKLTAGPPTRGQKRKTYELPSGNQADIYHLIMRAIALDPPIISITIDELKKRIDLLFEEKTDKPDRKKIKDAIEQVQGIISDSDVFYQVFEWKDEQIYILDPIFLFYLRWGVAV
ncbi:ATP-binding protein [Brevibacillus dissolubilis]|uniref:ATP-binding protein n=1 Tax=Brevibacillus dissolubilis TaxID=1844116 RepID=UPI0011173B2B|nr:ATP-binding protein [Brevibacillus dissolubilis]